MSELPLAFGFTAGVLAAFNPCAFALLPAYGAYYASHDGDDAGDSLARMARGLKFGVAATAGFVALFGVAGALVSLGVYAATDIAEYLSLAAAILLLAVGARLILGYTVRIRGLKVPSQLPKGRGSLKMAAFGVSYGVVSLACTLPVFLLVVATATAQTTFLAGLVLFVAYALGMGTVLTFVTIGTSLVKAAMIQRIRPFVSRLSGLALIAAAIYLLDRILRVGLPGLDIAPLDFPSSLLFASFTALVLAGTVALASLSRRSTSVGPSA